MSNLNPKINLVELTRRLDNSSEFFKNSPEYCSEDEKIVESMDVPYLVQLDGVTYHLPQHEIRKNKEIAFIYQKNEVNN